jgi:hypothetical protein
MVPGSVPVPVVLYRRNNKINNKKINNYYLLLIIKNNKTTTTTSCFIFTSFPLIIFFSTNVARLQRICYGVPNGNISNSYDQKEHYTFFLKQENKNDSHRFDRCQSHRASGQAQ